MIYLYLKKLTRSRSAAFSFTLAAVLLLLTGSTNAGQPTSFDSLDPTNLLRPNVGGSMQNSKLPDLQPLLPRITVQQQLAESDNGPIDLTVIPDSELPQNTLLIIQTSQNPLAKKLWYTQMSPLMTHDPLDENKKQIKVQLKKLIDKIKSIEIKQKDEHIPVIVLEQPQTQTDTPGNLNEKTLPASTDTQPAHEPDKNLMKVEKLNYQPVSEQTLKMLAIKPDQIKKPFELAQILFRSNRKKTASIYYQMALNKLDMNHPQTQGKKAWILLQIGNCLKETNPVTAMQTYRRLIAEHPNCPWIDVAKVQQNLINWYRENEPLKLIKKSGVLIK